MNTEVSQDNNQSMTVGNLLRQAREQLGLSHQEVAESLYLKQSTVRDIEEDNLSSDISSTFVRGYILSYAKLVHLLEEDVLSTLTQQTTYKMAKAASMQSFSLSKSHKKHDLWLMNFTWFMVFVVLSLTGAWWWQNHQAQQEEAAAMANRYAVQVGQNEQQPPLLTDNFDLQKSLAPAIAIQQPSIISSRQSTISATKGVTPMSHELLYSVDKEMATLSASNELVMLFSADCWLQVVDSSGKILFSGIQKNSGQLNLVGAVPYRLTIGVPSAVQIQYHGKLVDLNQFIKLNRVAHLTIPAQ